MYKRQERIEAIHGPYEDYFESKKGIGPLKILKILDVYIHVCVISGNRPKFEILQTRIPGLTFEAWKALKNLLGVTPWSINKIKTLTDIRYRPLYFLSDDSFLIFCLNSVYDAIFYIFKEQAKLDESFINTHYKENCHSYLMKEVTRCLSKLFPLEVIYTSLHYSDPDKASGHTCELDKGVFYNGFFLGMELKGGDVSDRTKSGSLAKIFALKQINRVKRYLHSKNATFKEEGTGRKIRIDRIRRDTIILLNITLPSFVGITTIFDKTPINKFQDPSNYPISLSIKDFEIITLFSKTPEFFLAYLRYRLSLQTNNTLAKFRGDEIDIFAGFCKNGPYWRDSTDEIQIIGREGVKEIDDYFEKIYLGHNPSPADIQRKFPKQFDKIISQLQACNNCIGNTKTLVALLMASTEAIDRIEQCLLSLPASGQKLKYATIKDAKFAVCIGVKNNLSREELRSLAYLEKYISKVDLIVCIGIENTRVIHTLYIESPWMFSEFLEKKQRVCIR